jgi:hypothetical protein
VKGSQEGSIHDDYYKAVSLAKEGYSTPTRVMGFKTLELAELERDKARARQQRARQEDSGEESGDDLPQTQAREVFEEVEDDDEGEYDDDATMNLLSQQAEDMELSQGEDGDGWAPITQSFSSQDFMDVEEPDAKKPTLSADQQRAVDIAVSGRHLFFTGVAGAGKSFTLERIIGALRAQGKRVAVTATTGVAATVINGRTVHSWAGVRLGLEDVGFFLTMFNDKQHRNVRRRWLETDVLVIDEVSMLTVKLFEKLEAIGRGMRAGKRGTQLDLFGNRCEFVSPNPPSSDDFLTNS